MPIAQKRLQVLLCPKESNISESLLFQQYVAVTVETSSVHSLGRYLARFAHLQEDDQHMLLDTRDWPSVALEPLSHDSITLCIAASEILVFCSGPPATSCDYDSAFEDDWEFSSEASEAPSTAEEEPQSTAMCTPAAACNLQPQMLIQQMGNHPILACLAAILASEAARDLRDLLWEIPLSVARFFPSAAQASQCAFGRATDILEAQEVEVDAEHPPSVARQENFWALGIVCGKLHGCTKM